MRLRVIDILLVVCLLASPMAAAASLPEYQVKAVFLHNFGKYVNWPAKAFAASSAPFVIGIIGDDPFGEAFVPLLKKSVQNRPLEIRRLANANAAAGCHVLFISRSEQGNLAGILTTLKTSSALTVSDMEGFTDHGGMIQLVLQDNRIRFDVNRGAAQQAGLTLSSNLLKLATVVVE